MKVTCTANGDRVEVDADASTTLAVLKNHIRDQTGIPPNYQNLIHNGRRLTNMNATLGEYGVGDTLLLEMHMRGGCGESCGGCGCGESCYCTIL